MITNAIARLRKRAGMTQSRLAEVGGTSQPTIAAYESGRKTPNLGTLERLARAAGWRMIVDFVPPLTREDRRSLALHAAIAVRLRADPGPVLAQAHDTLRLMKQTHPGASSLLDHWAALLDLPDEYLAEILIDPRSFARELRHVTPFAGILSSAERTGVYQAFADTQRGAR